MIVFIQKDHNIDSLISKEKAIKTIKKSHIWVKRLLIQHRGILRSKVIGPLLLLHLLFDLGFLLSHLLISFQSSLQLTDDKNGRNQR